MISASRAPGSRLIPASSAQPSLPFFPHKVDTLTKESLGSHNQFFICEINLQFYFFHLFITFAL